MTLRIEVRASTVVVAALVATVAIAACGSSGAGTTTRGDRTPTFAAGLKYADCMRRSGVSNFPDPMQGGGFQLNGSLNPQSPSFQAAARACLKLQPGRRGGPPTMSRAQLSAALKFSRCMRDNGVRNFPDPAQGKAAANSTEPTLVLRGMAFQSLTGLDLQSPQFRKAMAACGIAPAPPGSKPRGG